MAAGRELKFSFAVDEASFAKVKRALAELTTEAQKFAKTLQGTGGFFGGANVGRGGQGQQNQAGGGQRATATTSISSAILKDVEAFKSLAKTGGDSMNAMTAVLKRGIAEQSAEVAGLDKRIKGLIGTFQHLGQAEQKVMAQHVLGLRARRNEASSQLQDLQSLSPAAATGQTGQFGAFRNFINGGNQSALTQEQAAGVIGGLPGGQYLSPFLGAGGVALGLAGGAASLGVGAATWQARAAWNSNLYMGQQQAANVGLMQSYVNKVRGGNYEDIRAMRNIGQDPEAQKRYNDQVDPDTRFNFGERSFGDVIGSRLRNGVYKVQAAWNSDSLGGAWNELTSTRDNRGAMYRAAQKGRQREFLDLSEAGEGLRDLFNETTQNVNGKMSTQRALGIGNGYNKNKAYRSNADLFLAAHSEFDPGEIVSAVQGIAAGGSRGAAYANKSALFNTVLQAQGAGIAGAANTGGVMSRAGAQQGSDFVDLMRSLAGSGTDVSTTGLLGAYVAQQHDRMSLSIGGGAGLLATVGYGTQDGDGALRARQNIQGFEGIQDLFAGKKDAWQKAVNFQAAMKAAPDLGYYDLQKLGGMDAARVAEVLRTPSGMPVKLTPGEIASHFTGDMIRKTAENIQGTETHRTALTGFTKGTPQYEMRAAMDKQSWTDYAAGKYVGANGKFRSTQDEQEAFGARASILMAGNKELTESQAYGRASDEWALAHGQPISGKRVGDTAGGSREHKEAKAAGERAAADANIKDAFTDQILKDIEVGKAAYARLRANTENLSLTAGNIAGIIKALSQQLADAMKSSGVSPNSKVAPTK